MLQAAGKKARPPNFDASRVALFSAQQVAQQRDSEVHRHQKKILQQRRPLLNALVFHIGFRFLRGNNRRDVLQKIDPALLADSAMALLVLARRTLEAQRRVATPAEPCDVSCFAPAFRAYHHARILLWCDPSRLTTPSAWRYIVNSCVESVGV